VEGERPETWYVLACRTRGLGTAWTTLHLVYEQQVAELLGLPGRARSSGALRRRRGEGTRAAALI
jgi:hypothetical protein